VLVGIRLLLNAREIGAIMPRTAVARKLVEPSPVPLALLICAVFFGASIAGAQQDTSAKAPAQRLFDDVPVSPEG
jgi:hypothetical protein